MYSHSDSRAVLRKVSPSLTSSPDQTWTGQITTQGAGAGQSPSCDPARSILYYPALTRGMIISSSLTRRDIRTGEQTLGPKHLAPRRAWSTIRFAGRVRQPKILISQPGRIHSHKSSLQKDFPCPASHSYGVPALDRPVRDLLAATGIRKNGLYLENRKEKRNQNRAAGSAPGRSAGR
jgi:hypothetical protein